ncbi:MAG: response regulator [bacterium]|nr:response regulator [bacterium]
MEKILIVEDEIGIRETLEEIFELAGYDVSSAKDGKEGYQHIIDDTPDIVVCDVSMPEMNGFELLGAINERLKDSLIPPFLFLTAKVEPKDIRTGMSLGADDYILKPFDHNELLNAVRLRLEKRKKLLGNSKTEAPVNPSASLGKLAIPSDSGLQMVSFSELIYCEAERAYCRFHLASKKTILVSKSMKEFEDILTRNNFLKVHKSNIVNIQHIDKYLRGSGGQVLMTDGSIVPVSIRKKEQLLKVLKQ